jgi:hypothetical protein
MEALYNGEEFSDAYAPESIANILACNADIEDLFPDELRGEALPYFVDWLVENVHLVEITAYSDGDAYAIFETMNDRGLSLSPTDMLKGYLLANIDDADKAYAREQRLEGARSGIDRAWQRRGRRRYQVLVAQSVRRQSPRAKARCGAAGLRSHRHRVPPLGTQP